MARIQESRSLVPIARSDLARLAKLATTDRSKFIANNPRRNALVGAYRCTALCQGAALHFLDGKNGVKDFDVWSFYAGTSRTFPPRRLASVDYGLPKFGRSSDRPDVIGRRVDLLGRGLAFPAAGGTSDLVAAVYEYLERGETATARRLSEKAVGMIDPPELRGTIVWRPFWHLSLRDVLDTLAECGIRPKRGVSVEDIAQTNYGAPLEADDCYYYLDILGRLGFERAVPPHDELSNNVHYTNVKVIYEVDAYTAILRRLVALTRGRFPVRKIWSRIDFEGGVGELRFVLDGDQYSWPIKVNKTYLDGSLVVKFARLFRQYQSELKFTFYNVSGQDCLIGCATNEEIAKLRRLTGVWFATLGPNMI